MVRLEHLLIFLNTNRAAAMDSEEWQPELQPEQEQYEFSQAKQHKSQQRLGTATRWCFRRRATKCTVATRRIRVECLLPDHS